MATLKSLVDETTNIKNELVECHTNLKNNLIAKGVECSDNDKMLNLINEINTIEPTKSVVASDNILFQTKSDNVSCEIYTNSSSYVTVYKFPIGFNGSIRVYGELLSSSSSSDLYANMIFNLVRNGLTIETSGTLACKNKLTSFSYDFDGIKSGDVIEISIRALAVMGATRTHLSNVSLRGDIL